MRWNRFTWSFASVAALPVMAFAANDVAGSARPTYANDIAPILNQSCVKCHRPGEIGPMSLRTYDEVRPWAKSIGKLVGGGEMPPWHADPGYGPFKNDRSLSQEQVATITRWVEVGAPKGNLNEAPPAPEFSDAEWTLGEPDYIVEFEEIEVPANGPDRFYDLAHETNFDEDKWVKAVQILPGDREVVHHVILWQGGQSSQGWLDAWAAGNEPTQFPEGTGRLLKKGTTIIGDMHYHPIDRPATDRTRVGLYFADDEDIEKELVNLWVMNAEFEIPAGDPNYQAKSRHTFDQDSHILTLTPHLHYRGKDFKYTLKYPDGKTEELLKVSDYDFNWQTTYILEEPIAAPKGSTIECVAHWDNSANNPDNPDPTKDVRFGNESYDEMMIGFVDFIVDEGLRPEPKQSPVEPKMKELAEQFPGEVYEVNIPGAPDGGMQVTAMHLPREGQGGWYVEFNGIVGKAPISEINWDGNNFTCKVNIPGQGIRDLEGSFVPDSSQIKFTMAMEDGQKFPMTGNLVE